METVTIVLNIGNDSVEDFERGFREHELPVWEDFVDRGIMLSAALSKLDISNQRRDGVTQYSIMVQFADGEGHHLHDSDPRFQAWNQIADQFQPIEPFVFGGETIIAAGG
jgi:hypothetical protein